MIAIPFILKTFPLCLKNLETTSLSTYYDIDFKHDLQLNVNDDNKYNMDNGNSIHTNNVDEYYVAHIVAAGVHNNESITYQIYNDTVCDIDIYDIVNTNNSCIDDNDQLYQLRDPVSSDIDSDTDSISDAHQETPPSISTIEKPIFLPEPFDMSKFINSYPHRHGPCIRQHQTHTVEKQHNSVAAYKQQLTALVPQVVSLDDLSVTPYNESTLLPIHAATLLDNESPPSSLTFIKSSPKSAAHISQINSYPLLDICHEDNNCNCDWNPNNDDVHGFNHVINNNNREFINNNKNSCDNNPTTAADSVADKSYTQSTALEGNPQRTQDQSSDSSSSLTSINKAYNYIHHIRKSSTEITHLHHLIFDNSNAPLITINPISTSISNSN